MAARSLELLIKLQKDRELTLIVCSASLNDASLLCDRFIVLDRGTVVMDGPVREVLRQADRLAELDITCPSRSSAPARCRSSSPTSRPIC